MPVRHPLRSRLQVCLGGRLVPVSVVSHGCGVDVLVGKILAEQVLLKGVRLDDLDGLVSLFHICA